MIIEALSLGGLGLIAAVGLGVAARVFAVEVDPLVEEIEEALPGANCGGCGQAGCASAAVAIVQGKMDPSGCVAGGPGVAVAVAALMGVEVREVEPRLARVSCRYPVARADVKYEYSGVTDCRSAFLLAGGPKECVVGCMGLGSCVKACSFGALSIGPDGLPVVDEDVCTGCGACTRACPVGIMRLTSVSDRILGEYGEFDCTAPCQARCPAGIDIPQQLRQTAQGNYEEALKVVMERNPLPLICGRICPNPCEFECRRNQVDEPLAINHLKRFVADRMRERGERPQLYKAPATGKKAAIIGGGADGLSAAFFLSRLGHEVELFEAQAKLGGLLRSAIQPSRLPRDILDWEIDNILALGVTAHTGQVFGRDVTPSQLFGQGHQAIYLALGGWDALLMSPERAKHEPALPGLYTLLPLLLAWAKDEALKISGRVILVGQGENSLATARKLVDKGADSVTIIWREGVEAVGITEDMFQLYPGIDVRYGAGVQKVNGRGDGITGLTITVGGESEFIEADTIIAAAGRLPDLILAPTETGEDVAPEDMAWEAVAPYRPGVARGLFLPEEAAGDYRAAVEAIAAGRRAAASAHRLMSGQALAPDQPVLRALPTPRRTVEQLAHAKPAGERQRPPETEPAIRAAEPTREVVLCLDEEAAKTEARRCLDCGLICYQRTQYH